MPAPSAYAACTSFPYALTNGTTADAAQVMGNYTYLSGCLAPLASPSFSGNVGIGTTSPVSPLDVYQNIGGVSPGTWENNSALTIGTTGAVGTKYIFAGFDQTNNYGWIGSVIKGTSYTSLVLNPGGGNVGIGTTAPNAKLQVTGAGFFTNPSSNELTLNSSGTNYAQIYDTGALGINGGIALGGATTIGGVPSSAVMFWNVNTGNVGVGTTSPSAPLHVYAGSSANSSINIEDANANPWGLRILNDSYSTNWSSAFQVYQDNLGAAHFFNQGSALITLSSSNVGIGTASPTQALEVNGEIKVDTLAAGTSTNLCVNANVIANCSSSLRYKENVRDASFGLKEVLEMRPVTFKWKGRDEEDVGLIAEEVEKISPLFVTYKGDRVEGVKYAQLTAVLAKAVQEQQREIEALRSENRRLGAVATRAEAAVGSEDKHLHDIAKGDFTLRDQVGREERRLDALESMLEHYSASAVRHNRFARSEGIAK